MINVNLYRPIIEEVLHDIREHISESSQNELSMKFQEHLMGKIDLAKTGVLALEGSMICGRGDKVIGDPS